MAGADGCKAGWVVASRRPGSPEPVLRVVAAIAELDRWDEPPAVLGIDVPIGLLDRARPGGRDCDRLARSLLGQPRARSVFSPPTRPALRAKSFEEALRRNRATAGNAKGSGLSRQSFGILPKIREVDEWLSRAPRMRVHEVHPELSFFELRGGRAVLASKKSKEGFRLRRRLLEKAWNCPLASIIEAQRSSKVAADDIIDAMAACWTAERILAGRAVRLPSEPPTDSRGLRMEIVR